MEYIKKMLEDKKNGICPLCKKEIEFNDFCDIKSIKEYTISGICQLCQDCVFIND